MAADLTNEVIEDGILSEFEEISFSFNFEGDTILFTDDYGHILEVKPNNVSTYGLGAGLDSLVMTGTGGAMGLGTALLSPEVLVVIAAVLAAGVVAWAVEGLVEECTNLYHLLSLSAQAELLDIYDSIESNPDSDRSFSFTESTSDSFAQAFHSVFYDGDLLRASGLTYSPEGFLDYNSTLPEFGETDYPDSVGANLCIYPLTSEPVSINNTSLKVSLADNVFGLEDTSSDPTLLITNDDTDVSLYVCLSADVGSFLNYACSEYRISAPYVRSYTDSLGRVYNNLGFYILRHCLNEDDDCCFYNYTISTGFHEVNDNDDPWGSNSYFLFSGTGIAGLDDKVFNKQNYNVVTGLFDLVALDGSVVSIRQSALETVSSNKPYAITLAPGVDVISLPGEDDKIYLPPLNILDTPNNLTHAGATSGDWGEELTQDGSGGGVTVPDTDSDFWSTLAGWFNAVIDAINSVPLTLERWFSSLLDAITAIPNTLETWFTAVIDAITSIPDTIERWITGLIESVEAIPATILEGLTVIKDWITDGVLGALKVAFIPDETFFEDFFANLQASFENRFGLLTYPISVIYDFLDSLLSVGNVEPVLSWGSWSYKGTELIPAGSYNLNEIVEDGTFNTIYNIYLIVVDCFLIFLFLGFIQRKYRSIISS